MKFISLETLKGLPSYFGRLDVSKHNGSTNLLLFLVLKRMGVNPVKNTRSLRTGRGGSAEPEREASSGAAEKALFELTAMFNPIEEEGKKCTAVFPLGIRDGNSLNRKNFYNRASDFNALVGRISDSLTNASFLKNILLMDEEEKYIKFVPDYLEKVKSELKGHKISIENLVAWTVRFKCFVTENTFSDDELRNAAILSFLEEYHITKEEFSACFSFDDTSVKFAAEGVSAVVFRSLFRYAEGCEPQTSRLDNAATGVLEAHTISESLIKEKLSPLETRPLDEPSILALLPETEKAPEVIYETGCTSDFSRNRIIFGAPGTGKSYRLAEQARILLGENREPVRVTFHPEYSYFSFVGSYKPVMKEREGCEEIGYDFVPGPFMEALAEALKEAKQSKSRPHLIIIEEINRARAASVFGDLFQLLDRDSSGVSEFSLRMPKEIRQFLKKSLDCDFTNLRLPDNLFIWATMNSADQGVFPLDTAFKRRWDFEYIGVDENEEALPELFVNLPSGLISWKEMRKYINQRLEDIGANEDKLLGPFFISHNKLNKIKEADPAKVTSLFIEEFKSKVLSYLFEDAARLHRPDFFRGSKSNRFSSICADFERNGLKIFG